MTVFWVVVLVVALVVLVGVFARRRSRRTV
jgi:MYXO-CTERM domain-containing protein